MASLKLATVLLLFAVSGYACGDVGTDPLEKTGLVSTPPDIPASLIEGYPPLPSPPQLEWENAALAMFIHFGMNTMTDREVGTGFESPMLFNPDRLDASQWVRVGKSAGFKYLILTAKHHDGFCLWPSQYTDHSVRNSPFRGGHGDVVREFADACREAGVKFGVYLSPADRHEPTYGTEAYNTFFVNQLTELMTGYGEVDEVWFDGADGEMLTGKKQPYDWPLIFATVRRYQPRALIAAFGPDIRWVGNERGVGNQTEWCPQPSFMNMAGNSPTWYPSECDVSIRPGWFYHEWEDGLIKGIPELVSIYLLTVGRNSNLLLNVPPDRHGLICDADASILLGWRRTLDKLFGTDLLLHRVIQSTNTRQNRAEFSPAHCVDGDENTFWTTDPDVRSARLTVNLGGVATLNAVKLEEAIQYGQRISAFTVYADQEGQWLPVASGTTIGRSRMLEFSPVSTTQLCLSIEDAKASPTLRTFSAYLTSP